MVTTLPPMTIALTMEIGDSGEESTRVYWVVEDTLSLRQLEYSEEISNEPSDS